VSRLFEVVLIIEARDLANATTSLLYDDNAEPHEYIKSLSVTEVRDG
jgi:hypothetical protein